MEMETKLAKYLGYRSGTVDTWKNQLNTSTECIDKVLEYLWILGSQEIRSLLRKIVRANHKLFAANNCYICKFGPLGKSGEVILYEFTHALNKYRKKVVDSWNIPSLPEKSIIIFLDDLVGTGAQSTTYITDKIMQILNPSHKPYLMCLCATSQGIEKLEQNTNFHVIPGVILDKRNYQYLSDSCSIFQQDEKEFLRDINNSLLTSSLGYYDHMGLLLAFYFAVPNNTLPFIWKDKASYRDLDGVQKEWQALLPRYY